MENKIVNTFTSDFKSGKIEYYTVNNPIYINGDYKVYQLPNSVLYTYKDYALNELVKFNQLHLDSVVHLNSSKHYKTFWKTRRNLLIQRYPTVLL